jgi:hypothetical protein
MLRPLGVFLIGIICLVTAPWGLMVGAVLVVVGSVLFFGWFMAKPAPSPKAHVLSCLDDKVRVMKTGSCIEDCLSAVPLLNAVYCADCELITNSPHDVCGICGSHSVVSLVRMLERAWRSTNAQPTAKRPKYKLNLTAEVREIPADELSEITKLITRLAEAGGDVKCLHINVDPVGSSAIVTNASDANRNVLTSPRRTVALPATIRQLRRQTFPYGCQNFPA